MYKAYNFRLYPNDIQKELIHKTFGCSRFIYNYFLSLCKENGYRKSYNMFNKLKELEKEHPFLKEVDSCSLRCSIFNLEDAYKNYFSRRSSYPIFKSKFKRQSYRTNCIRRNCKNNEYSNIELDMKNKKIKLPKLGLVDIRGYRNQEVMNGKIINATVIRETTNKYYVSVIVEEIEIIKEKKEPKSIVGIDLGIKDLVITSDGEMYENKKELERREKRLKRIQRKLSRQIKGSNNYQKTKIRLARIHNKIRNSRKYHLIDIVNKLVKEHDIIVSEKLKVKGMVHNNTFAKKVLDAGFSKICSLLEWKSKKEGKYYYQVDSYYPSSQICSRCGKKNEKVKDLSIRKWECESCKNTNERDINASINIMFEGLKLHYQK